MNSSGFRFSASGQPIAREPERQRFPRAVVAGPRTGSPRAGRCAYRAQVPSAARNDVLEAPCQLGGEAAGRGDVELAVADLAVGHIVAAVAEVPADDGDPAEGEIPGDAGVGLVERVGPEGVAPVHRALRLVAHR